MAALIFICSMSTRSDIDHILRSLHSRVSKLEALNTRYYSSDGDDDAVCATYHPHMRFTEFCKVRYHGLPGMITQLLNRAGVRMAKVYMIESRHTVDARIEDLSEDDF